MSRTAGQNKPSNEKQIAPTKPMNGDIDGNANPAATATAILK